MIKNTRVFKGERASYIYIVLCNLKPNAHLAHFGFPNTQSQYKKPKRAKLTNARKGSKNVENFQGHFLSLIQKTLLSLDKHCP